MIRVLLVDDHTMVRQALRTVLEHDREIQVVAEAGDAGTALRMTQELAPDIVVMDVALPGVSGIEATRCLRERHPGIKVLALSSHLELGIIDQMLAAGSSGYIVKSAAASELIRGIRGVLAGNRYFCPEVTALVAHDGRRAAPFAPASPAPQLLTTREIQVTTLLARGKSAPQIAAELHISFSTVAVHRRNIMRKLGLHNVVELVRYAVRMGLVLP